MASIGVVPKATNCPGPSNDFRILDIKFICNVANDLFHDIFQCHNPDDGAVLINHERHQLVRSLEVFQ